MLTTIQNLLVPVIALVGLILLIALGDVTASVGVPIIAGLAGVHIGANLPGSSDVTPVTGNRTLLPPGNNG